MSSVKEYSDACEAHRREARDSHLRTAPVNTFGVVLDYASAGLKVQVAMHHLDEGLPGQQKLRCEAAFHALQAGYAELQRWMRANGYDV